MNGCLGPDLTRWASLIGAPDLKLFPQAFNARSVLFRAGLELGVMHWGLALLARLRALGVLPGLERCIGPIGWLSRRLERFGGDRGGMAVEVTGLRDGEPVRRAWRIVAEEGCGPFIPAIPAVAIIAKMTAIAPGARPCLGDLTLAEIESAMARLAVRCQVSEEPAPPFFQKMLGEAWRALPASVRRLHSVHDVESFSGRARVTRGTGLIARLTGGLFRFPQAGADVSVTVIKYRTARGEIWERNFSGRAFRSRLTASPRAGHCRERFFPFTFELELPVSGGSLHLPVRRGWLFGIPLPRALLPRSEAREYEADGGFHFDVALYAPLNGGLIVRYQGHLTPDCESVPGQRTPAESMAV